MKSEKQIRKKINGIDKELYREDQSSITAKQRAEAIGWKHALIWTLEEKE